VKTVISFYQSSIGKKWIVALTGIILVGFVVGHMLGNLQIFLGQEAINAYAEKLQSLGALLWVVRIVLLLTIIIHICTTVLLAIQNKAARPQKYAVKARVQSTVAARTMLLSGLTLIAFILFHLMHFTVQNVNPEWKTWVDSANRHDVYNMMIAGFESRPVSLFYIIAVFLLTLHMSHGIQSFLQTLGGRTRKLAEPISKASPVFAWAVFFGYISIPVAVLTGLLQRIGH